ncbi:MAG: hypothetical protein HUK24_08135, partial [Sphaerochaetaceae bacterium]|nr:hypothetical protein [Sphaerochaetaceae bacterium]
AIAKPAWLKYKPRIHYHNGIENQKGPFLLLCNHNAFLDFKICYPLLKGKYPNFVVAIDGYIGREGLMRNVGCICKRKFTSDISLVKNLLKVAKRGDIPVLYPEARYSLCGTTAVLPSSLGKMIKLMKVPVATLICHGHHINSPFWDTSHERGIPYDEAHYSLLFTADDVNKLSSDEINEKIVKAFAYDDFAWQRENNIKITDKNRADGLEKVLYQCPHCKSEYHMVSSGHKIKCTSCNKEWEMDELGVLHGSDGVTEFSHIPSWYEWERSNVREEVRSGKYSTGELPVVVKSLPNAKGFIDLGSGIMTHNSKGFYVKLNNPPKDKTCEIRLNPLETYSVHIEYRYLFKNGDCVDLNTFDDTWYVYPQDCLFSVTKMALATEELYFYEREKIGRPCKAGLA